MLSFGVDSVQVGQLSVTLLLQSLVSRFLFFVVGLRVDLHDLDLLLGVNKFLLGLSSSPIDVSNSLSLDLVDDNLLLTPGLGEQDGSVLFSLDLEHILVRIGLQNLLLRVNLGSLDLGLKLQHLSLVVSLLISQLLVLVIFKLELLVLLFLLVVFELELQSCLFLQSLDKLWVDLHIGDVALLELDAVHSELGVELGHHGVGHV